jgi:PadR family transcriptional regulator, regulatory protein AphA
VTRTRLSPTSLAILGLLALRPFSAYELAQQIHRGLRYMQPASERNLYAEPKRLAAAGLVRMRHEPVGRRTRTIYEITPAGRQALRRQLTTPPAPPQLEFEALQRLIFADQASKHDLLAALDTTSQQVQQLLADGLQQVRGYQADGGPFPHRLHLIVLFARFSTDFLVLVRDWVALARHEAASWPTTRDLGLTDGTRQLLADLLRLADQLTPEPPPATSQAAPKHPPTRPPTTHGKARPGTHPA